MVDEGEVTRLLREFSRGDSAKRDRLFQLIYEELHRLAAHLMRFEAPGHTLQTTALVSEAYLHLVGPNHQDWNDRAHFIRTAATAMRHVLVDHARSRRAAKRGGPTPRPTSDGLDTLLTAPFDPERMLALDAALTRLETSSERQCRVVELLHILGFTVAETAEVLNVSERTVKRDWRIAQAWLRGELSA